MKVKQFTTEYETRVLFVEGALWCGQRGSMGYPIDSDTCPRTGADAKRIAGDFDRITKAEVVTTKRKVTEFVHVSQGLWVFLSN